MCFELNGAAAGFGLSSFTCSAFARRVCSSVCGCVTSARSAIVCGQCFVVTSGFSLRRVLLRVRMLYYLKQEVIGSLAQKVLDGVDSR